MTKFLALGMVICGLIGLLDASYLSYEKITGVMPPCSAGFECEKVLTSAWSNLAGIPLAFLGVIHYGLFLTLAIINFLEIKKLGFIIWALSVLGLVFSAYFVFLMGWVIESWCVYCLVSAINSLIAFIITSVFLRKDPYEVVSTV